QVLRRLQDMARDLNMITIAEGLEARDHLDCAQALGIDWGQGYLWGRAGGLAESEPQ
ncbi:MAG: EAL domain-containing protein, partial [Betaproteobacteria bacterium]|nr:EAL domain-containing protein [Betaproteobacteria bacterium]MDE2187598.1 EAL domain-containing protein [Betaproteobacteria bacterium]